jgi:hypothetical protein
MEDSRLSFVFLLLVAGVVVVDSFFIPPEEEEEKKRQSFLDDDDGYNTCTCAVAGCTYLVSISAHRSTSSPFLTHTIYFDIQTEEKTLSVAVCVCIFIYNKP